MSRWHADRVVGATLMSATIICGGLVLLIVWFLVLGALPAFDAGRLTDLFVDDRWQPGSARDPQFGVLPMLAASIMVTMLAIAIAAPLGLAGAVFHQFYLLQSVRKWNRRALELLAGVPSVVFGFWGLTVLVPAINRIHPPGQSLLAASLVLALMILPTVALTAQSALQAVPESQLLAAAGLGLGRARTILSIALPAARSGIVGGAFLATARAIGETMAVVMVCGNIAKYPGSVFDPVRPVTATIALEMGYATASHKALLYAAGLLLVLVTAALVGWLAFRKNAAPCRA
ncbi:MAG: phosphate ABC transporter permease subunit PstC [Verrucomicrobiales bacterium]